MTTDDGTVHWYGLRFLEDVWDYYVERAITARQAILFAHVDYFVNPRKRKKTDEHGEDDWEPAESKLFRTSTLEKVLQCSAWNVGRSIRDLRKLRRLFKGRYVGDGLWRLATKPREVEQALYLHPEVRKLFESGAWTPDQTFVMGLIASYTRNGQYCWLSNRQIGKKVGLKIEGVRYHLYQLRQKGELTEQILSHDEAREALEAKGVRFKRSGGRTSRFLFPTRAELWAHGEPRHSIFDVVRFPEDDEEEDEVEQVESDEWDADYA